MATVTDSSLLTAAHDIVSDFLDKKASLNDGVIKKAGDLGLNTDQTSRLIERTNTEAFLRIYPNDTEFEVASPEVVMGIKTSSINSYRPAEEAIADDGLFKAASVAKANSGNTVVKEASISDYASSKFTDEDIFGMDNEFFKTAAAKGYDAAIDRESQAMCAGICSAVKTASEVMQAQIIKEEAFDKEMNRLGELVKEAALRGTQSVGEAETELLNAFPGSENLITTTFDAVTTKLASDMVNPELLTRSQGVTRYKYASETPLTRQFERVLTVMKEY